MTRKQTSNNQQAISQQADSTGEAFRYIRTCIYIYIYILLDQTRSMLSHLVYVLGILYSCPRITHLRSPKDERGNTAMPCHANNKKRNSICVLTSTVQFWDFHEEPCIVLIRVPSVEPQGRTRQHCNRQIMKTMPKGSVRQFLSAIVSIHILGRENK